MAARHQNRLRSCIYLAVTAFGLALGLASPVHAAELFAVISERSAGELLSGARRFASDHPGHTLILRTTAQLAELRDEEVARLWAGADAVFIGAAFGDEAARLDRLLQRSPPPSRASVVVVHSHSASDLLLRSRLDGVPVFEGLDAQQAHELARALIASADDGSRVPAAASAHALRWLEAERYYSARGGENFAALIAWLLAPSDSTIEVPPVRLRRAVRFVQGGRERDPERLELEHEPVVAIVDYDYGDRAGDAELHDALCRRLDARGVSCFSLLSRWGESSIEGLERLAARFAEPSAGEPRLSAIALLQDFVVGGGSGSDRAAAALERLGVPVIKGVRLGERSELQWRLSEDGLPQDSVHYRVAMPELQGAGQPFVLGVAGEPQVDSATGIELRLIAPVEAEVSALADRCARWSVLQRKGNAEKRVAIVYYNHPPGRHNIGADNLDVPASLMQIIETLAGAGYRVGAPPRDEQALLSLLQRRGVNLPEDREALAQMAGEVRTVSGEAYARYFDSLPEPTRLQTAEGPLAALAHGMEQALSAGRAELAAKLQGRVLGDVRHLLEGVEHPARERALSLLSQLESAYASQPTDPRAFEPVERLTLALRETGIEGLDGWGRPPGRVMSHGGRLLVPGIELGNLFIGPQPPRGWELDEELLHANLAFAPPHQYLAFYRYLREEFHADVVVHLGRHSTYEFLPGRRVGVGEADFSRVVLGDLPSVYVYIVDGVGEGIQAKRRGQAVIVDHLTPSLSTTPLYDELLRLRQLVETFETAAGSSARAASRAVSEMRRAIDRLNLRKELTASMQGELSVRGIGFDEVDDELLVHEVGHYLTAMQERFMPYGLHVFGRRWEKPAVERMLRSMSGEERIDPAWRRRLLASPRREQQALLAGLDGRFIEPGPGNDPIRTPAALPTGRNFHALDSGLLPTRLGYQLGAELAHTARSQSAGTADGSEAVVLWASDTVRDEGAMVGFGLDMLGVRPVWNSRGVVQGLERVALEGDRVRRDTTFVSSGLFRDLYGDLLALLDRAVLVALAGSSVTIRAEHPELSGALAAALAPLGEEITEDDEPLAKNQLAAHWVESAAASIGDGMPAPRAGRSASLRLFGNAPGGYGAGVNRLAERSGAWRERGELAEAYLHRMGHGYGAGQDGEPAHDRFAQVLARVEHTYLGRASNLYGLLDNNDGFDYLGGLGMAVERQRGSAPLGRVIQHADPSAPRVDRLTVALMQELRGRHLNPEYLQALMKHGYAGARTMGSEFFENLWGWQVTSPEIVESWVWDEVKAVYLDDKHGIGLDRFLEQGDNVHVKTNMLAVLLVAVHKRFWDAPDEVVTALAEKLARLIVEHGLPGSGHTRPDHPVMELVAERVDEGLRERFLRRLARSRMSDSPQPAGPSTIAEVEEQQAAQADGSAGAAAALGLFAFGLVAGVLLLLAAGFVRGRGQALRLLRGRRERREEDAS